MVQISKLRDNIVSLKVLVVSNDCTFAKNVKIFSVSGFVIVI